MKKPVENCGLCLCWSYVKWERVRTDQNLHQLLTTSSLDCVSDLQKKLIARPPGPGTTEAQENLGS